MASPPAAARALVRYPREVEAGGAGAGAWRRCAGEMRPSPPAGQRGPSKGRGGGTDAPRQPRTVRSRAWGPPARGTPQ
eukprot:scaffold4061_cov344-Prasinococcus_capsulatus_cf.AAC.1